MMPSFASKSAGTIWVTRIFPLSPAFRQTQGRPASHHLEPCDLSGSKEKEDHTDHSNATILEGAGLIQFSNQLGISDGSNDTAGRLVLPGWCISRIDTSHGEKGRKLEQPST